MDKNFWFDNYDDGYPYYGFKDKNAFEFFVFLQQETFDKNFSKKDIIEKYKKLKYEECVEAEKHLENIYPSYKAKIKECEGYALKFI